MPCMRQVWIHGACQDAETEGSGMSAQRKFFAGMRRKCKEGHVYFVTEYMCKRQSYECKKCASRRAVEYAKNNREKKRKWNNDYFKRNGRNSSYNAKYRKGHPEVYAAHRAVRDALRLGLLKKKPCNVCGEKKVQGHHEDYSKPLKVDWLCQQHHMERHWK